MYNVSYANILLLKNQKEDVSFIIDQEAITKYRIHPKENENPLKIIKAIKSQNKVKFKTREVFDISQTDYVKKEEKEYSKEYVETMLKGMCSRRGINFEEGNIIRSLESLIMNIRDHTRQNNFSMSRLAEFASQNQIEVDATIFVIAKKLNISTKDCNLKNICKWGVEQNSRTLKESLQYIQKFTNYFMKDFKTQQKLQNLENEEQDEME